MEPLWCETEILTIVILDSFSDGFDFTLLTICAWCEKQNRFERCFSTSDAMILSATMTASFFRKQIGVEQITKIAYTTK